MTTHVARLSHFSGRRLTNVTMEYAWRLWQENPRTICRPPRSCGLEEQGFPLGGGLKAGGAEDREGGVGDMSTSLGDR